MTKITWTDKLLGWLTGESPEQIAADFEATRKELLDEYTAEERRQLAAAETANYVEHVAGCAMREVSYNRAETVMYWQEYVIDQQGRKHVLAAGETAVLPGQVLEIVVGEIVDELPVYAELQGGAYV